jgi:hypothetical protein
MAQTALVQEVVTIHDVDTHDVDTHDVDTHDVDVVTSLGLVHDKIDRGLTSIPEYQALLAVRKSIEDMSEALRILDAAVPSTMGDELIGSLRSVEDRAHDRLLAVPEYKALLIVRKSIGDISALYADLASPAPAVEAATRQAPSATETTPTPLWEHPAEEDAPPAATAEAAAAPVSDVAETNVA